jgi:hypothetical protein
MLTLKAFGSKIITPLVSESKLGTMSNLVLEKYFKLNTMLNLKRCIKILQT